MGFQGTIRDVSDWKRAEKSLRRSANFLGAILDALSAHIAVLNDAGVIMRVNKSWLQFADANNLGWDDYGVGRNYLAVVEQSLSSSDTTAQEALGHIRDLLYHEKANFQLEYPCHSPEKKRWFMMNGTVFDTDAGRRVVVAHENITQRKLAEEKAVESNKRLEETLKKLSRTRQRVINQERQRALTHMASGIAHDFNNALSIIRGFSDLLLRSPDKLHDVHVVKEYLQQIRKATSNAAETVRRMRKFYRPRDCDEHKHLDINSLAHEAISMSQPKWQAEAQAHGSYIEIENDLNDVPKIMGNEVEIHEMLTNLIFNAIDAMPEDGTIEVRTIQKGENVLLEVSDDGIGMSEDVRQHCLEPFFTTKKEAGTGLGLSTVHGVVKRHKGRINVQSKPGEGTTFQIWFPVAQEAETGERVEENQYQITRSLKILIIEDNEKQRRLMQEYLKIDDHQVDLAPSGRDGIAKFMNGWYDLVITDRAMPEMGGDEVARQIKSKVPEKPVLLLTGFGDMMKAASEDVIDVDLILSKPVTLDELREGISIVMNG